jgi:hypothetical protein
MFARKARRAWGLAERTTQPTTTHARDGPFWEAAESDGYARLEPRSGPTWRHDRRDLELHGRLTAPAIADRRGARTTIDQDIVACVMATLTTGEQSSRVRAASRLLAI